MGTKLVTRAQGGEVVGQANAKGISRERFQQALSDGSVSRFLDSLLSIAPPEGARNHVIKVRVNQEREWQEAVNAAGPDTPADYNVRKVGGQYPPAGKGIVEEELILLNFPTGGGDWYKATAWAEAQGLKQTNPRQVFAIGEQHQKLHKQLGQNPMYVVSTADCSFEGRRSACYVWWDGSRRKASLYWVGSFDSANDWFAFRK
jgi:hypothetical protein